MNMNPMTLHSGCLKKPALQHRMYYAHDFFSMSAVLYIPIEPSCYNKNNIEQGSWL